MTKAMTSVRSFILLMALALSSTLKASGTVVGNGGDPIFEFMEAARDSMIETVKVIVNDPAENANFCKSAKLSEDQIRFCHDFFLTVAPELLRLSQGADKILFVLRDQPLYVEGPDGQQMVVAARTQLGSRGPIELHRESVKTMLPTQVLFLLAHEFQHKTSFEGRNVTDNERIGPFATGRDLLDGVSSALVSVARRKGKVGSQFGLRDIFDCHALVGESGFGARLSSSRMFQSEDLMSYETSMGKNPTDGSIYVPVNAETSLQLRIEISEPNNCGDPSGARKTVIQIVRIVKNPSGDQTEAVVVQLVLPHNPMCPGSNPELEIASDQVQFVCRYYGSEGTTSSPWILKSALRTQNVKR